ncbi:hypothetical protein D3C75_874350 [compost metagenome]
MVLRNLFQLPPMLLRILLRLPLEIGIFDVLRLCQQRKAGSQREIVHFVQPVLLVFQVPLGGFHLLVAYNVIPEGNGQLLQLQ